MSLHDVAWHTLDIISNLHLIIFKRNFAGLFWSIKINIIITCKVRRTLEGRHSIMLPFDLVSCLSADVKHSYKLGKLFSVQMQYCISWRKCNIVELDLNCFSLFGKLKVNKMFYTNWFGWFWLHSCICFIYSQGTYTAVFKHHIKV